MPPLDPALEARVDHLWEEARAERPLFNGRIFSVDTITPTRLDGHWTEYRRLTAQFRDPALIPHLAVRSLAVCGALQTPDGGIAVGRREPRSNYQAGLWQLPPAGSVDGGAATPSGASWHKAILAELREELGIPESAITALRPLCLVQHPTGVLDMGIHIRTTLAASDILALHRSHGDGEYGHLLILPRHRILPEIQDRGGTPVPSIAPFLDRIAENG